MLTGLVPDGARFRTADEVAPALEAACAAHCDVARVSRLGTSEEGRPIHAVLLGHGERAVSLVAGAHSDEPVGPETLRTFVLEGLRRRDALEDLFARYTFVVVPHVNPDGEARNRAWAERWPDLAAYRAHAFRELPGRDLEFGYPDMRVENRLLADLWRAHAPFHLHMSLHGMAVAEGGLLLVERHWIDRTRALRAEYAHALREAGLGLHDHDREGEKGFVYIGPGFTTTPEGAAMRRHFERQGDPETAAKFRSSSMEFVRTLGGDPLCLVTEIPLWLVRNDDPQPGVPTAYLALREALRSGGDLSRFAIAPVPLPVAMRLQLRALELGLRV